LLGPSRGDFANGFAGSFTQSAPQIGRGRIRVFVRSDVAADAVAESVFAKKTLQHPQKTLAFAISDIVKRTVGVRFIRDRLLHRVRCRSCVAFHRDFLCDSAAAPWIAADLCAAPDLHTEI